MQRLRKVWQSVDKKTFIYFYGSLVSVVILTTILLFLGLHRPWYNRVTIGGRFDSPWLGSGFYTKEQATDGLIYRWMVEQAVIQVPAVQNSYVISLQASRGPIEQPQALTLRDNHKHLITIPVQKGFRVYSVFWQPDLQRSWFLNNNRHILTLQSPVTQLPGSDQRIFGTVFSGLGIASTQQPNIGAIWWAVLFVLGVWLLVQPRRPRQVFIASAAGFGGIICFLLLSWRPIITSPWLPIIDLPAWLTLLIWGWVFARWSPGRWYVGALVLLGFVAILLFSVSRQWDVIGPDFLRHEVNSSSFRSVFQAHPFYPFGFPLILWLGLLGMNDPLAAGRIAAFISIVCVLGLVLILGRRLLGAKGALLAALIACASPVLLAFGVVASTDSVQLVPLTAAFVVLLWHPQLSGRTVWWSGVLFGVAYLFRFQALMMVVLVLPWLLLQPLEPGSRWQRFALLRRAGWAYGAAVLLAGFVVGSAPQWLLDIRDTGRPFWSKQYENIWTFAYNRTDGVIDAAQGLEGTTAPDSTGLYDILAFDPYQLARHWSGNLHTFGNLTLHELFLWPFGILILVALVLLLLQRPEPRLMLCAYIVLVYVPIIALTANKDRFYLPLVPLVTMVAAWALLHLCEHSLKLGRWQINLGTVLQAAVFIWVLRHLGALEAILPTYGQLW